MTALLVETVAELRAHLDERRAKGQSVGAVPTMGALHEGHLSLVREAARNTDVVVVTIFVNPTQFGPGEDFDRYPRDLEKDVALATSAGANVIFAPPVSEMYPQGEQTRVRVPGLSQGLCGASRPGHFDGVATVVTKIFHVIGAGKYFFGKKDFQQWRLIEQMARDLLFPVEIIGCETVREEDGLALSSRNVHLTAEERLRALSIPQALQQAISARRAGRPTVGALREVVRTTLERASLVPDYVEIRSASNLAALDEAHSLEEPSVLAVAVRLSKTRLIDNVVLKQDSPDILPQKDAS